MRPTRRRLVIGDRPISLNWSSLGAIVITLLLVTSLSGGIGSSPDRGADGTIVVPEIDSLTTETQAKAVIVNDDGDAVFVYTESVDAPPFQTMDGKLGVESTTGAVYGTFVGTLTPELRAREASGIVNTRIDPASAVGEIDIVLGDPKPFESLDASATVTTTEDTATTDLAVEGTIMPVDSPMYPTIKSSGVVERTASTITSSGQFTAEGPDTDHGIALEERRDMTITQHGDDYRIEATESRAVGSWERERWETRENATRSLETRYMEMAIALGGKTIIDLVSYEYEDEPNNRSVDLKYRVELIGVSDQVADRIADELASVTNQSLPENERRVIADRIATVEVETVSLSIEQVGLDTHIEWDISLSETDALARGIAEVAGGLADDGDPWIDRYDDVRASQEAQEAANVVETSSWNLSRHHVGDSGQTTIEIKMSSTASNWDRYVDELDARDRAPFRGMTMAEYVATVREGDDLELSGNATTTEHAVVLAMGEHGLEALEVPELIGFSPGVIESAHDRPHLSVARIETSLGEERVSIEKGAIFEDEVSGLGTSTETPIDLVLVEAGKNERTIRLIAPGVFHPGDDARTIREHPWVGTETEILSESDQAGDETSIDEQAVRSFLEPEIELDWRSPLIVAALPGALLLAIALRLPGRGRHNE